MNVKNQNMNLQLVNKGILCSKSVKAEMNGSYVASLDRFSTKNRGRLQVEDSKLYLGCFNNYFLTQTHFNELSQKFQISYNQFKVTDLENRNFNKEVYTLQEQDNSLYFITLTAQPELHNNVVYERLYVKLLTSLNQGLISGLIIDQNGETWFNPKKDEITLLGKSFNDVYIGEISKQDVIACNRIYYTSNEGVVGFTDENGELWVLHEIK